MEIALNIIFPVIALGVAVYVFIKYSRLRSESQARISTLELDKALAEQRRSEADKKLSDRDAEHNRSIELLRSENEKRIDEFRAASDRQMQTLAQGYEQQLDTMRKEHQRQLEHERETIGERFKALASDVLQANTRQLDERSRQSIEAALSPMKTSLEEFTKGYRECYDLENRDRLSLREEIRSLHELNTRVGREAGNLANALKGNTGMQGRWGEMVLTSILEKSGLQQDRWFTTQESTTDEDGSRLRPDAVIHCPKNRDIIIDSKVSITHYLAALDTSEPEARNAMLAEHLRSVETHVKALQNKEYQKKIGSRNGNFVFMFMPHEGAYIEAMRRKPGLWETAFDNNVVIVSPTHLVTAVRLVEQMWLIEDQSTNAQKIAETGQTMIDSVQAFLADMTAMGKSLDSAQKNYDSALKRLTTGNNNVLRVAERLQKLGITPKKALPLTAEDTPEGE